MTLLLKSPGGLKVGLLGDCALNFDSTLVLLCILSGAARGTTQTAMPAEIDACFGDPSESPVRKVSDHTEGRPATDLRDG